MSIINIKCKCGKEIKVNIKTIDKLQKENKKLKKEIADLKCKVASLETMKSSNKDFNFSDFFNGFNK